jgi:hypothetical protein
MSKLSFRSRQVDYQKPLPIYLNHDLPDLQDFAAINRSVPQMPTGMEKDEEAEHHLQRALSALQAFGANGASSTNEYAIPTPKVEIDNKMYESIYNMECPKQKQYIRIQPFSDDYEYPDYDADFEDERWLNEQIQQRLPKEYTQSCSLNELTLFFETIMDRLEKTTSHSMHIMSLDEAKFLLMKELNQANSDNDLDSCSSTDPTSLIIKTGKEQLILNIYEYWKAKRLKLNHPLTPIVLTDKSGVLTAPNNPYLVFRRRTEKMQTRKNRKNEEQSYEKMLILKRDLCKAQQILKLIKKRENLKKEFLKLTLETFEKRFQSADYDGSLTESIKCSLKPQFPTSSHQQQLLLPTPQAHAIKSNSSIDKTIANLINSNKFKTISETNDRFFSDYDNSLKDKKRLKKDKQQSLLSNTTNLNNLEKLKSQNLLLKQHQLHQAAQRQQFTNQLNNNTSKNQKLTVNNLTHNNQQQNHHNNHHNNEYSQQQRRIARNRLNHHHHQQQKHHHQNINRPLQYPASNPLIRNTTFKNQVDFNEIYDSENNYNESIMVPTMKKHQQQQQHHHIQNENNSINSNVNNTRTSLDILELNKRLLTLNNFNIDLNDLNECNTYDAELKLNNIENLEAILNDTKNNFGTNNEKDGYWCFKRKEGCKYLPQNGSIFKSNESPTFSSAAHSSSTSSSLPTTSLVQKLNSKKSVFNSRTKSRLKQLQYYYYGYAITKKGRHLGLVRRRMGRGGRVLFERYNRNIVDLINTNDSTQSSSKLNNNNNSSTSPNLQTTNPLYSFNYFSKFKTYYPKECFDLNDHSPQLELQQSNLTDMNEKILLPPPPTPLPLPLPPSVTTASIVQPKSVNIPKQKLKLKNFLFDDLTTTASMPDLLFQTDSDDSDSDDQSDGPQTPSLVYDHNLFPIYQLKQNKESESVLSLPSPVSAATPMLTTTNGQEDDSQDFTNIDKFFNDDHNLGYLNGFTEPNDDMYESNCRIRLNIKPGNPLNDEFNSRAKNDNRNLSVTSVKFALKNFHSLTLKSSASSDTEEKNVKSEIISSKPDPKSLPPLPVTDSKKLLLPVLTVNPSQEFSASNLAGSLMQTLDQLSSSGSVTLNSLQSVDDKVNNISNATITKTNTISLSSLSKANFSQSLSTSFKPNGLYNGNENPSKDTNNITTKPEIPGTLAKPVAVETTTTTNTTPPPPPPINAPPCIVPFLVKRQQQQNHLNPTAIKINDIQQWYQYQKTQSQSLPSSSSSSSSSSPSSISSFTNYNLSKPVTSSSASSSSSSSSSSNNAPILTNGHHTVIPVSTAQKLFQAVNFNQHSTASSSSSSSSSNNNNSSLNSNLNSHSQLKAVNHHLSHSHHLSSLPLLNSINSISSSNQISSTLVIANDINSTKSM